MARVELIEVSKIFNSSVVAVDKVSFVVEDGEFAVILGPSGCGKTTILRLIAGLEDLTEGLIYIGERLVNNLPPKDRDVAMVFQSYALYPHMSVFDNIAFPLKMRKLRKEEIRKKVEETAKILGIEELLRRKPRELSGGQKQRVALGRAIVRNPKVFLFDEPLSNLDAKMRVRMRAELARIHRTLKATSIYVTHDQAEAMTLGDKIILLMGGKVQQISDPLTLYNKPRNKFVAGFIGSPPMNFFVGEIERDGDEFYFITEGLRLQLPREKALLLRRNLKERKVILGIRPEDIKPMEGEVRAKVDYIETLGNETIIYARFGGNQFVSRGESGVKVEEKGIASFKFLMKKAHFFDLRTEENLTLE